MNEFFVVQRSRDKSYWWGKDKDGRIKWGDLELAKVFKSREEFGERSLIDGVFHKLITVREAEVSEIIET